MTNFQLAALLSFTGVGAVVDFRTGRIPNSLIVAGALAALGVHVHQVLSQPLAEFGWQLPAFLLQALLRTLVALFAGAILPLCLYRAKALGGGDVKLLAVAAALLPLRPALELIVTSLVVATLWGIAKVIVSRNVSQSLSACGGVLAHWVSRGKSIQSGERPLTGLRFGPALFAAACFLVVSPTASKSVQKPDVMAQAVPS